MSFSNMSEHFIVKEPLISKYFTWFRNTFIGGIWAL